MLLPERFHNIIFILAKKLLGAKRMVIFYTEEEVDGFCKDREEFNKLSKGAK